MATRPTIRQFYDALEARFGQEIADAFAAAIEDLKTAAELQRAVSAVQAGDLDALMDALHIDPAAYGPVLDQIEAAYEQSGQGATSYFPPLKDAQGLRFVIRFNVRNPRAENWVRTESSTLITNIIEDQRAAIRVALDGGLQRGENPTTTALNIIGRMDKSTGQRTGGIIGLTEQQARYVQNARAELSDPATMGAYFDRTLRDRRFDRTVAKAIREETPLDPAVLDKAIIGYERKLLKLRGDTIGRTESITALRAAKREAYLQAVESGAVAESAITRKWRDAGDSRVRDTHEALNGKVVGLNEPYVSPSGARLMFPGDPSAPARERINCRCDEDYHIDFLAALG